MSGTQFSTIQIEVDSEGVGTLLLNRPKVHNAFNETMINEISQALEQLDKDYTIRVLCIQGAGRSFCAGADLNWMKRTANYSADQNYRDAMQMAKMMHSLYRFSKPTVAIVHGAIFGGGVGLVACSDIVIAEDTAIFCLSEVKLGLIPAVIGPYVVNAMGPRIAKRYILSAERFDATTARRSGLVHECVDAAALPAMQRQLVDDLLACGPQAQHVAKSHVIDNLSMPITDDLQTHTADLIATIRASDEGREGISAFLEKRHPNWRIS